MVVGAAEQRAAGLGLLVDEDHPRAGAGGGQRGGQAGRAGADHEHVGVARGRRRSGRSRRSSASRPWPGMPRATSPSYSSTVVASSIGSGNGSSIWTRPPVSSAQAAVMPRGRPSLMLVADLVHAVGQQRRGQGVAGVAGQLPAVEGEGEGGGAVDAAAARRCGMVRVIEVTGFGSSRR